MWRDSFVIWHHAFLSWHDAYLMWYNSFSLWRDSFNDLIIVTCFIQWLDHGNMPRSMIEWSRRDAFNHWMIVSWHIRYVLWVTMRRDSINNCNMTHLLRDMTHWTMWYDLLSMWRLSMNDMIWRIYDMTRLIQRCAMRLGHHNVQAPAKSTCLV